MIAQVAHAAGHGSSKHPDGTFVVVLAVPDELTLRKLYVELRFEGVDCTAIVESDRPYENQMTAIGCGLVRDRSVIRRVVSSLPLAGRVD
jgi:hypothetical protein